MLEKLWLAWCGFSVIMMIFSLGLWQFVPLMAGVELGWYHPVTLLTGANVISFWIFAWQEGFR